MTSLPATTSANSSGGGDYCPAVRAAARGDQTAFGELYQQYARPVYNLVLRCLRNEQAAEDTCQEVWVKAYRELHRLEEPQAFPAWLYRIAARACVDAARKSARAPMTAELLEDRASLHDDPERSALQKERVRLTWEALAVLPARQHLALFLREMERRSYKEISQMLETSESAVETLLFRARHGFAKAFERLEAVTQDRCRHAHRAMAAIMDGEATPVQQRAVRAHVDSCRSCSGELTRMQRAAAAYAALVPLPVPALLGERIFGSLGAAGTSAAPAGIAKFLALAGIKAKVAVVTLVATTTLTAAAMATPIGDQMVPGPAEGPPGVQTGAEANAGGSFSGATESSLDETGPGAPGLGLVPVDTELVDGATTTLLTTVDETVSDASQTVDALVHEGQTAVSEVLPPAPVQVGTDIVPTPVLPLPTPTALPSLPPLP